MIIGVDAVFMSMYYTVEFFQNQMYSSKRSAEVVIPLVLELVKVRSVIDVGCGVGTWLSVFKNYNIDDIVGIDGDYVKREMLYIPEEKFIARNLEEPIYMNREFDLVISLELAEHLDGKCADTFIGSLTRLGPVILFSAAIPFQGCTSHINEQWQEYWSILFNKKGYKTIDCIRKEIWNNENVDWWYRQNIMLFVDEEYLNTDLVLKKEFETNKDNPISIVHPMQYLKSFEKHK